MMNDMTKQKLFKKKNENIVIYYTKPYNKFL